MNEDKPAKYGQAPIDLNLPNLPFYRLTNRPSNKLEVYENEDKSIKIAFIEGKPSTQAQKMLFYLLSKSPRKNDGAVDTERLRKEGIKFTYSEVCKFLEITNQTVNRRRIKDDLIKLGNVSLHLHTRYIVKQGTEEANYINIKSVGLFEINLYDDEKEKEEAPKLPLWQNQIKFDNIILENLSNNVFRLFDVRDIQKIKNPTPLRIYGIISLHNQSKIWKIGLVKLAKQIPIQTKILKNTKKVIKKACDELKELNLILGYSIYANPAGEEIIQFEFSKMDSFSVRQLEDGHKKALNLYESLIRGIKLN